jgi:heptaprenyl diphosphate synthase
VAADLATVEAALRNEIDGDPDVVAAPMADLFAAGGKRLRPALVLLSARCGHYDLDRLTPAAMAVELTHAATLVHDDVIDRAPVRRGRPTVAASLGDEPAIVIGDFYFAKAYEHAARTDSTEVVGILARTVMDICAGEVRQQEIRYRYSTDVDEYMRRIAAKTATLLAACCDIGAVLAGLSVAQRNALHEYGRLIGLAFQIADDVLDYMGSEGEIGKRTGQDIAEGFATLPLMLAKQDQATADRLEKLLQDGRKLNAVDAAEVVEIVRTGQAPQLALARAREHASAASKKLEVLGPSDACNTLAALTGYVVTRKL